MRLTNLQQLQIVPAIIPVDLSTAANPGDWVSMKNHRRLWVVFLAGIGTAGQDPVLTLEQATSAAGAGAKALAVTTYYKKQGATALSAVAQFTEAEAAVGGTFGGAEEATSAENEKLWVVEVKDTDLDGANGFTHVRVSCADVGANAQLGAALYILGDPRRIEDPAPGAIA